MTWRALDAHRRWFEKMPSETSSISGLYKNVMKCNECLTLGLLLKIPLRTMKMDPASLKTGEKNGNFA
jgi:hypothetical protein